MTTCPPSECILQRKRASSIEGFLKVMPMSMSRRRTREYTTAMYIQWLLVLLNVRSRDHINVCW